MRLLSLLQISVLVIALLFFSQPGAAQSFVLNGMIEGKDTGSIVLIYTNAENKDCGDTAFLKYG